MLNLEIYNVTNNKVAYFVNGMIACDCGHLYRVEDNLHNQDLPEFFGLGACIKCERLSCDNPDADLTEVLHLLTLKELTQFALDPQITPQYKKLLAHQYMVTKMIGEV